MKESAQIATLKVEEEIIRRKKKAITPVVRSAIISEKGRTFTTKAIQVEEEKCSNYPFVPICYSRLHHSLDEN